jgi:hypothetical protein
MAMKMTEEQIYEQAKKRVEEKRGFFSHLAAYVVVNIILFLVWFYTSRDFPWFIFPLGGWGIGLLFHFLGVFVFDSMGGQKAIEKEAARIRDRQGRA